MQQNPDNRAPENSALYLKIDECEACFYSNFMILQGLSTRFPKNPAILYVFHRKSPRFPDPGLAFPGLGRFVENHALQLKLW